MKIVIIGAGSTVFTPGLIADLTGSTLFADATVALVDINPQFGRDDGALCRAGRP